MDKAKPKVILAALIGFGTALSISGFAGMIATFFSFTWARMAAAVAAFAIGLSMMFFWAETGGENDDR